jgi:acetaldehyde dehydrogenase (acetylating)
MVKRYRAVILGTGNIGTDLLIKVLHSRYLDCVAFVGRNLHSPGMIKAQSLGVTCSDRSISYIVEHANDIDLVFDATSASAHTLHAPILKKLNIKAIDLTPARIGPMCIPVVNLHDAVLVDNVNMVTCGGQTSIPIAYAIGQTQQDIEFIEVNSSIAAQSAGPATIENLEEYIRTTEHGIRYFSGVDNVKTTLSLNPTVPCIHMHATISALIKKIRLKKLCDFLKPLLKRMKRYVPGYQLISGPDFSNGKLSLTVKVKGLGDYLPEYAGNLDIINCAALATAEEYARVFSGDFSHSPNIPSLFANSDITGENTQVTETI